MNKIVTLTDGREGFFYRTPFCGNLIFQPIGPDGCNLGDPELADENHVVAGKEAA